ncbi:ribonuclease HI family protein [Candidatus Micrarchaeota archaeon]|nr:ribonuclease HI family protein [Candidatus Micrarchaeota archaeon]
MINVINKIVLNTDGGARGNPGPGAIGIVVQNEDRDVLEVFKRKIGKATNNEAEYKALIKGLELALNYTNGHVICYLDSELVQKQAIEEYQVKALNMKPLFKRLKWTEGQFKKVEYKHVKRDDKYQQRADKLVNDALGKK